MHISKSVMKRIFLITAALNNTVQNRVAYQAEFNQLAAKTKRDTKVAASV